MNEVVNAMFVILIVVGIIVFTTFIFILNEYKEEYMREIRNERRRL